MVTIAEDVSFEKARRAPRYDIHAPVRFRAASGDWREGTTVNVGRLGMLIRTSDPMPPLATALNLRVALATHRVWAGAYVTCTGRVVWGDPTGAGETLMAVTIDDFQLRPARCAEEDGAEVGTP